MTTPDVTTFGGGTVTPQDMVDRGKFITVGAAKEFLAVTEPMSEVDVETGPHLSFRFQDGWNNNIDDIHDVVPVNVFLSVSHGAHSSTEYQLTKGAVLELVAQCHIGVPYAKKAPVTFLVNDPFNYWFKTGLDCRYKLLVREECVFAVTKPSVTPFSNIELLDRAVSRINATLPGSDIYVDLSKMSHSLNQTYLQLVVPQIGRTIQDSGEENDIWWGGLQVANSQTGSSRTAIDGFLFRQLCSNGMIEVGCNVGSWSRRSGGNNPDDVYAWAENAVDEVLGGLEGAFDTVQSLTELSVEGEVGLAIRDVFEQSRIPVAARHRVMDELVEDTQATMYSVANAITAAANADGISASEQQQLMRVGGSVAAHAERCGSCHRLLPDGVTIGSS